jgi:hypothetical protein
MQPGFSIIHPFCPTSLQKSSTRKSCRCNGFKTFLISDICRKASFSAIWGDFSASKWQHCRKSDYSPMAHRKVGYLAFCPQPICHPWEYQSLLYIFIHTENSGRTARSILIFSSNESHHFKVCISRAIISRNILRSTIQNVHMHL